MFDIDILYLDIEKCDSPHFFTCRPSDGTLAGLGRVGQGWAGFASGIPWTFLANSCLQCVISEGLSCLMLIDDLNGLWKHVEPAQSVEEAAGKFVKK